MSFNLSKVGVILLLLLLLIGPVLQAYDCFNDSPNLDHDGILHGIDALLCIAFGFVVFGFVLLGFMRRVCWSWHLPLRLVVSLGSLTRSFPVPPIDTSPLMLRI